MLRASLEDYFSKTASFAGHRLGHTSYSPCQTTTDIQQASARSTPIRPEPSGPEPVSDLPNRIKASRVVTFGA